MTSDPDPEGASMYPTPAVKQDRQENQEDLEGVPCLAYPMSWMRELLGEWDAEADTVLIPV